MGDNGRKSHALHTRAQDLPPPKPRPGTDDITSPYIPHPGEVGWVRTSLYAPKDPAEWRPGVVLSAPSTTHGYIQIATRTSDLGVDGVAHQADDDLGLGKDGMFADLHVVAQRDWFSHNVRYSGVLAETLLAEVLAWFE